jgi:hypothetical protein
MAETDQTETMISIAQAARILHTYQDAIRVLIERGELATVRHMSPISRREKHFLKRSEVEQLAAGEMWQRRSPGLRKGTGKPVNACFPIPPDPAAPRVVSATKAREEGP